MHRAWSARGALLLGLGVSRGFLRHLLPLEALLPRLADLHLDSTMFALAAGHTPLLSRNFSISGFRLTSGLVLRGRGRFGGIGDAFGSSNLRGERPSDFHIPFFVDIARLFL